MAEEYNIEIYSLLNKNRKAQYILGDEKTASKAKELINKKYDKKKHEKSLLAEEDPHIIYILKRNPGTSNDLELYDDSTWGDVFSKKHNIEMDWIIAEEIAEETLKELNIDFKSQSNKLAGY